MAEGKNLYLLVNPFSAKAKKVAERIISILASKGVICITGWPENLSACSEAWIVGGDGTVNYFLNKYKAPDVPIAVFKAGTGNDIHWKLYGNMGLDAQVDHVLNSAAQRIDCATCNDRFYINSSGLGFDGEVLRSMDTIRWMGGHLGYLYVVIRKIFSFRESGFKITLESGIIENRFLLVAVNNSSRTGGGFLITPSADLSDGKLDIVLCEALPVIKRLRYLPVIEKGKHLTLPFIRYIQASRVKIECSENIYGQLDGELISGRSFVFNNLAGRLLVRY